MFEINKWCNYGFNIIFTTLASVNEFLNRPTNQNRRAFLTCKKMFRLGILMFRLGILT
jgi:hypothetical protein